jgi:hypothetical protein
MPGLLRVARSCATRVINPSRLLVLALEPAHFFGHASEDSLLRRYLLAVTMSFSATLFRMGVHQALFQNT